MPASELADLLLFRNNEKTLQGYRKKLEAGLREQGETLEVMVAAKNWAIMAVHLGPYLEDNSGLQSGVKVRVAT